MATKPIQDFRTCTKCGAGFPATKDFFNKKLDGLAAQCRPCTKAAKRIAWAKQSDEINATRRAKRDEVVRTREREYYARNSEKVRRQVAAWKASNPEKLREIDRKHYLKFSDKKKRQAQQWAEKNPERKRKNTREWYRHKRATDPIYRLRSAVSAYVYWCLTSGKNGKRTFELLGYTADDLREHLERQFLPGMTWENYGDWHVDHILPVSSFNFDSADDPEFQACWALPNLRPLWAADNIAKSDKRTHLI